MFLLNVQAHYDSAHFLRNYHGKCEKLHGHRYVVEAGFAFDDVGEGGMAYDFSEAKAHLRAVADYLDHENLNELPPFDVLEPSAEEQARWIFQELGRRLGPQAERLAYVKVWETPSQWALYSPRPLWVPL